MNDYHAEPHLENFSAGYWLVSGSQVYQWPESLAVMDEVLFRTLKKTIGEPVVGKVENATYHFKSSKGVPADAVAVPDDQHQEPEALLVPKQP